MQAWGKAVPPGPDAHVWVDEVADARYARLTIAFAPLHEPDWNARWASLP